MRSVLQDWVMGLGLRHQGVLVSAVRGCDMLPKQHPFKTLIRAYRGVVLQSFDPNPSSFIIKPKPEELLDIGCTAIDAGFDEFPAHYLLHFLHAAQIVAFKHPLQEQRDVWNQFYLRLVRKMHLKPEEPEDLEARLGADEETFREQQ